MADEISIINPIIIKADEMMDVEGRDLQVRVSEWINEWYGERCNDHEPHCPICRVWDGFDKLFEGVEDGPTTAAGEGER